MRAEVLNWTEKRRIGLSRERHAVVLHPQNAHDEMQLKLLGLGASDYGTKQICLKRKYQFEDGTEDERRFYIVRG
jgi:hypothetical protein